MSGISSTEAHGVHRFVLFVLGLAPVAVCARPVLGAEAELGVS